jgi:hypothetical protein
MSCEYYHRLLHLNRPGERTKLETDELAHHLRTCEQCAALEQQIAGTDEYVDRLKARQPVVPRPEILTEHIIASVTPRSSVQGGVLDGIRDFLFMTSTRYAFAASVCLAVSVFMFQYSSLLNSVHLLEERIAEGRRAGPGATVTYTLDRESIRRTGALSLLQPILDPDDYSLENGDITVQKTVVDSYVTRIDTRRLQMLASAYGVSMPAQKMENIVHQLKAAAAVKLRLDVEGG